MLDTEAYRIDMRDYSKIAGKTFNNIVAICGGQQGNYWAPRIVFTGTMLTWDLKSTGVASKGTVVTNGTIDVFYMADSYKNPIILLSDVNITEISAINK